MTDEKKKMTAQGSSVGADDGQSISKNSKIFQIVLQRTLHIQTSVAMIFSKNRYYMVVN